MNLSRQLNQAFKNLSIAQKTEIYEKSIFVSQLPNNISHNQLHEFFCQFGRVKEYHILKKGAIVEFHDGCVVESLLNTRLRIDNKKIKIYAMTEEDGRQKKVKVKRPTADDIIGYNNIEHIFKINTTFESQFSAFLNAVQLTEKDLETRYNRICPMLDAIFKTVFPKCKTYEYGSSQMGLGFKDSDLDIYMDIGEPVKSSKSDPTGWTTNQIFSRLKNVMYRHNGTFRDKIWIPKAKVPIVKFCYSPMKVSCDMCVINSFGIYKTNLIKYYLTLDERCRPLILFIKYWARHFKLTNSGKLSNFALTMLVIFFLQQPSIEILPPVIDLQRNCVPEIKGGWQVNFDTSTPVPKSKNTSTIPELLQGFFSFYAKLDLESIVICPLTGIAYKRSVFKDINSLPNSMYRYKEYLELNNNAAVKINAQHVGMSLQDPIVLCNNIASSASLHVLRSFNQHCATGVEVCESVSKDSYNNLLPNLLTTMPAKKLVKGQFNIQLRIDERYRHIEPENQATTSQEKCSGKFCHSLAGQFVRSALEEVHKLQVESIIPTNNINKLALRCIGTLDDDDSERSDDDSNELRMKPKKNDKQLNLMCTFRTNKFPLTLNVLFSNQGSDDEHFREFVNMANLKISPYVTNAFSKYVRLKEISTQHVNPFSIGTTIYCRSLLL